MRLILCVLVALLFASRAAAQDPTPEVNQTPVRWLERPSAGDIGGVLPAEAVRQGISGSARLSCRVTTNGSARDCEVIHEEPVGLGYGQSALLLSRQFLFHPATENGVPVERSVQTTIRFNIDSLRVEETSEILLLTSPTWLAAPTRSDVDAAFPDAAEGSTGRVVLRCDLSDEGELERCRVLNEVPDRRGFGRAARSLTSQFRVAGIEGRRLSDYRILLPIQFDPPGTPAEDVENTVIPNPNRLALPGADDLIEPFPAQARAQGIAEGRVLVTCSIAPENFSTRDCSVATVDHAGVGFEETALAYARFLSVNRWSRDGRAFQRDRVNIPFRFVDPAAQAQSTEP